MERLNPTTSRALPTARPSLADQVASLPGFAALPEARREQLQRLLTTPREANVVAGFGQDVVRRLSNNPTFLGSSAEQQGAVLGLVFEGTWLPGTTADLVTGLEKTGTATLGEITACEPYRFSGAKTDQLAMHRTVTIDGHSIELVYPQDEAALYRAKHTPQSVALALQLMAPSLRAKINRVVISPLPFPGDRVKDVHEKYVTPGDRELLTKMLARLEPVFPEAAHSDPLRRMLHHAFGLRLDPPRGGGGSGGALAAAWRDPEHPGTLELYPPPGYLGHELTAKVMNHEAAHLWVYELIGQTRKPELFKTFGEARAADGFGVTRYEQSTLHEQIAEELTARVVVRECDNAAMDEAHRKLWPNLTMVIDKL